MTYEGNMSCTAADRGTSRAVEVTAVNEDNIYDADPEFRYLALSLTVKNRFGSSSSTAAAAAASVYGRRWGANGARRRRGRLRRTRPPFVNAKGGPDIVTSIERQNEIINFRLLPCRTRACPCVCA